MDKISNKVSMLDIINELFDAAKQTIQENGKKLPKTVYEGVKDSNDLINETLVTLEQEREKLIGDIDMAINMMSEKDWRNTVADVFLPLAFLTSPSHLDSTGKFQNAAKQVKQGDQEKTTFYPTPEMKDDRT